MRCLYCGKQLALLKRLTGGGEFCSDAHKQSYQEEYNRLALSRLLQAQSKPGEIKTGPRTPTPAEGLGAPLPPGAARRRALPSSSPEPQQAHYRRTETPAEPVVAKQVEPVMAEEPAYQRHQAPAYEVPEDSMPVAQERGGRRVFVAPPPQEVEAPAQVAPFTLEVPVPVMTELAEEINYLEPWLDLVSGPEIPAWDFPNQFRTLSSERLMAIGIGSPTGEMELPVLAYELAPVEFGAAPLNLQSLSDLWSIGSAPSQVSPASAGEMLFANLPTGELTPLEACSPVRGAPLSSMEVAAGSSDFRAAKPNLSVPFAVAETALRAFPSATPFALNIRVSSFGDNRPVSLNGALRFPVRVKFQDSPLMTLGTTGIDFPAEESEVILGAPWADEMFSTSSTLAEVAEEEESSASPREALEALSKLHQDLIQEQETAGPPLEPQAADLELVPPSAEPNLLAAPAAEAPAPTIDVAAEPVEDRQVPRSAHELFTIPFKTFAPTKPALAVDSTALVKISPELPRMKGLPLRPKVSKTPPGFSPQPSAAPAQTPAVEVKAKTQAVPIPARPEVKTTQIPVPAAKQSGMPAKPAPPLQPVKTGQPVKPAQPVKPVQQPGKPPQAAKPAPAVKTVKTSGSATPPKPPTETKPQMAQPKPVVAKPSEIKVAETKPAETKPAETRSAAASAGQNVPAPHESSNEVPGFASLKNANVSFMGSLKGKLTIAILLVAIAGGSYIAFSGKTHRPPSASSAAEDAAGPSIMLGEGGWVQGWAGDTNGSHAGRQITMYRPSLKLADYRIEFQGEIDSKSIGWVFRAMDPYNYYVMKLAIVAPGLSPKIALIKYSVVQGQETEIGQVPINIPVRGDTLYNIRIDVRGSKFSTYVQGQAVDVWTDERLKSGGVGFLNERAERARIKSASISYLTGGKN